MRLGLRLFLGFFLIVGLAAFFVMRVFVKEVKPGVRQAMESTLVDAANVLAVMAAEDLKSGHLADGRFVRDLAMARQREIKATVWQFPKRRIDYRVSITDAHGIVIYDSTGRDTGRDNSQWNDVYRTLHGEYGARSSPEIPGNDKPSEAGRTVMHVAAPIRDGDQLIGVLTLSQPNHTFEPFIAASQRNIIRRGAWLVGLSALIGVLMTWWLMRGINRLNRYAQAVSEGRRVSPLPPRRDEIGDLGRAVEEMHRKLEGKAYVEQYVQSLTHEMKSPLAAIRAAAELLQEPLPEAERQRFAHHIQTQQQRLTETIDKLLALAEVEQHGWLQKREAVDAGALLAQVAQDASSKLAEAELHLLTEMADPRAVVQGDAWLLRQALSNLLDNAIAFSPPRGKILVSSNFEKGILEVRVEDQGPGIPDYAQARVFERFYSLARPSTGLRSSGLGLPFVREVARLHGGEVDLQNLPSGGAMATLRLPASGFT
ncbi:MAG: two-component system sensor histidine kinase CreC [Pseudoxanthomonas sp.]